VVFQKDASKLASNFSVLVFVGGFIGLAVVVGSSISRSEGKSCYKIATLLQARIDLERKYTRISYSGVTDPGSNLCPVSLI
jgi:hypothetical protein